ncbi:MAG: SGNH/GDSL hydrolase family protein [Candidatus Hydrogenedentes bacterium]|nr:SGNH/GDSL hydrolase family protein [Candidatus Hydrogenedentota bacterium]
MATKIRSGQTVLFIGDSITDCGRRAGERPLGGGYVKLFTDLLTIREPAKRVNVINKGIGGDNVIGLRNRWTDDVLRHAPDWLSIKIGINDLHGALNEAHPDPIPPRRYAEAYTEILERTRDALPKCRILLIDPFYLSTERAATSFRRAVLDLLPEYLAVVHRLSRQFDTGLVKTHGLFQKLLKHHEADTFCPEPVHPNATGHLAIAEAVYAAWSR